jgi:hypothetical protein
MPFTGHTSHNRLQTPLQQTTALPSIPSAISILCVDVTVTTGQGGHSLSEDDTFPSVVMHRYREPLLSVDGIDNFGS